MKNLILSVLLIFSVHIFSQEPKVVVWKSTPTKSPLLSVAFSPDGTLLACGSEDKSIYITSLHTFEDSVQVENNYFPVRDLKFVNNHNILVANGPGIKLMDINSNLIRNFGGNITHLWSFDFNPKTQQIIAGSYDKKTRIWDFNSGEIIHELESHEKSVLAACLSPDGTLAATGSLDRSVKIWNVDSNKVLHTMELHSGNILTAAFHPSGKYLATGSLDNTVRIWDVKTGKILQTLNGHSKGITKVAFTPKDNYLLSASYDKTICLWDIYSGEKIYSFVQHKDVVNDLAFRPGFDEFASVANDGEVILWKLDKAVFVENIYYNEIYDEKATSSLFDEKRRGESRDDFKNRQIRAQEKYQEIVEKYYRNYLEDRSKTFE